MEDVRLPAKPRASHPELHSVSAEPGAESVNGSGGATSHDATVVAGIVGRDADALAEVYREHSHAIFGFARCIVRSTALAEDVVQDVFVRLWNHADRFEPDRGSLRSYLFTLAHGRSIDLVRSESARRHREERDATLADQNSEEDLAGNHAVHAALEHLGAPEREALALAYFAGYSYRQVASMLDVPEGTIKNRIRSGLAHLRVDLTEDVIEP